MRVFIDNKGKRYIIKPFKVTTHKYYEFFFIQRRLLPSEHLRSLDLQDFVHEFSFYNENNCTVYCALRQKPDIKIKKNKVA